MVLSILSSNKRDSLPLLKVCFVPGTVQSALDAVLVQAAVEKKIPQTGWLKQQKLISHRPEAG